MERPGDGHSDGQHLAPSFARPAPRMDRAGAPEPRGSRLRIFFADDNAFVLTALHARIADESDLAVLGSAPRADDLDGALAEADVLVIDMNMPGEDPLDAVRRLRPRYPALRIIAFSGDLRPSQIRLAFDAGVVAFVSKNDPLDELVRAIRAATHERPVLSPDALRESGASAVQVPGRVRSFT